MAATQPQDFQVRGYMITACAGQLQDTAGEAEYKRIVSGFSPAARDVVGQTKAAVWYPVATLSEVLMALSSQAGGDEKRAQELLVNAGSRMALEATNTFLRILMRMLTPTLLAKKIPDLWNRDSTRGRLAMDVSEQKVVCHIYETEGFAHALCTITGFVKFALTTMGKTIETTTISGWSLNAPHSKEGAAEFVWK